MRLSESEVTSWTCVQEHIGEVCGSQHGIKVILSLLQSGHKHLPPHAISLLQAPERTVTRAVPHPTPTPAAAGTVQEAAGASGAAASAATDAAADDPAERVTVVLGASKKDCDVRRQELLGKGPGSLAAAVLTHCISHCGAMLRTQQGADVVAEAACGSGHALWHDMNAEVCQLHSAIAAAVGASFAAQADDGTLRAALEADALPCNFFASRALRRLAQGAGCDAAGAAALRQSLWGAVKGRCKCLVGTHGGKVLAALLETADKATVDEAAAELTGTVSNVKEWCATFHKALKVHERKASEQQA